MSETGPQLCVVSLNLRAYPNSSRAQVERLARLLAEQEPDIALLQECKGRSWFEIVTEATGMTGAFSHESEPASTQLPPDGCAVLVRPSLQLERSWRLPPESFAADEIDPFAGPPVPENPREMPDRLLHRFSARSLLAELSVAGRRFTVGSFHATPATGRVRSRSVREWKTYFHAGVARALEELDGPFLFAIDANEPRREWADTIEFHWDAGTPEARRAEALLGLKPRHRAEDLLRRSLGRSKREPAAEEFLQMTYETKRGLVGAGRRFDSLWATEHFRLDKLLVAEYESVLAAGGDHAILIAHLTIESEEDRDQPRVDSPRSFA